MNHNFTPDHLRHELIRYIERAPQLQEMCESEVATWRWGTERMLSPLPYFDQVERGARGANNWRVVDRRWVDSPNDAKDPVKHGLDTDARLRMFEQGSLHVLLYHSDWTDEITFYARRNELLTRYVFTSDQLVSCYQARRTDCCEEMFVWENGRVVKSVERMWIEEDGEFQLSEFQEVLHYTADSTGLLQEVRCETLKGGLPSSSEVVFRRRKARRRG